MTAESLLPLDAVLVSHDHNFDNLDHLAGVPARARRVLTTAAGAGVADHLRWPVGASDRHLAGVNCRVCGEGQIPGRLYRAGAGTPTFVSCAARPADPPP